MLPTPDTSHVPYSRVYEPAEDSFLMIDTLALPAEAQFLQTRFSASSSPPPTTSSPAGAPFVVEIGSGSGVVLAFVVAQAAHLFGTGASPHGCVPLALAVDVNAFALQATAETVRRAVAEADCAGKTGRFVGAVRSDLVSALRPGQVDVLLFNPPYVPTPTLPAVDVDVDVEADAAAAQHDSFALESHLLELAYAGGHDGMETTDRLLEALPTVLSPRGCAYILLCAQNRPDAVKARIRAWPSGADTEGAAWHAETVGSSGKQAGWEKLQIVRIWRQ